MNTLKRIGRFLWLLLRGPLKGLAGVAGGLAILWVSWLIGTALFGVNPLCNAIMYGVLGLMILFAGICVLLLIGALCLTIRDLWRQSAHPL